MRELINRIESLRNPEAVDARVRATCTVKDWCERMDKSPPAMSGNVRIGTLNDTDSLWNMCNWPRLEDRGITKGANFDAVQFSGI